MTRRLTLLTAALTALYASVDLPLTLVNNTNGEFADNDIYIAIIGQQEGMGYIYYDLPNSIRWGWRCGPTGSILIQSAAR